MPLTKESKALLTAFEHQTGVTADQVKNLREVINASPALVTQINAAVSAGHLKHFAVLPAGTNAGGSYDGATKTMNLPLSILTAPSGGKIDAGEVTFVLGHELQHGFNHAATTNAYTKFSHDVLTTAKSAAAVHDYTGEVGALIGTNRRDEAGAEIAGWNATVGRVHAVNPKATLKDIYDAQPARMQDFIDRDATTTPPTYTMKANLTVGKDLKMAATAANLEGMGVNYFDKPGNVSGLGQNGNSSYADYYGAYAASVVAQTERDNAKPFHGVAPHLTLDMKRLNLHESIMEQNGINLGGHHTPVGYYDSSTTPPTLHHFNHTATTHTYVPIHAHGAQPPLTMSDPRHPEHPDHALYAQVADAVARLDATHGRTRDATSENVIGNMFALAQANGMKSVSDVVASVAAPGVEAGSRLFVVENGKDNPSHTTAYMATTEALKPVQADVVQRMQAELPEAATIRLAERVQATESRAMAR